MWLWVEEMTQRPTPAVNVSFQGKTRPERLLEGATKQNKRSLTYGNHTNIKEKEAEDFNRIVENIFINEQRGSESESDAEEWKEVKC